MRGSLLLCAALLLGVSACGDGDTGGTTPSGPPRTEGPAPTPGQVAAELTVTVADGTGEEPVIWSLTCAPTGGDHPRADPACETLAGLEGAEAHPLLTGRPTDVACTEQYGGPQTATVEGSLGGRAVNASLSRTDGCEISRWDLLGPVVGGASIGG